MPRSFQPLRLLHSSPIALLFLVATPSLSSAVIKLLVSPDERLRKLFVEGNRLAAGLDHPSAVPVLRTGALPDGQPWALMPFLPGGSLADRLVPASALPTADVLRIGVRIADVLEVVNSECGFLHRDIKPGNILLSDTGEPLLGDPHVAGALRAGTSSLTTDLVTVRYAAPEVLEHGRYSVASEVYSLATTVREMWTACPRPACPDLDDLFTAATATAPADRPSSAAEVAGSLRGVQLALGLPVTPPLPSARPGPPTQDRRPPEPPQRLSRRTLVGLVGATGVATALGGAAIGWLATGDETGRTARIGLTTVGLNQPWGLAVAPGGNRLLVSDTWNLVVRSRELNGLVTETVAGDSGGPRGRATGEAGQLGFEYPCGLAFAPDGAFYVADSAQNVVRRVDLDGSTRDIVGGRGPAGPAGLAPLRAPHGLVVDLDGALYVADTDNHRILRVTPDGQISVHAGTGEPVGPGGDGRPATEIAIAAPEGLALAADGTLIVTQWTPCLIHRISPDGLAFRVAGTGEPGFNGDGPGPATAVNGPGGPAFDGDGGFVFTDMNNNRVRRVGPDDVVTTVAGIGRRGTSPTGTEAVRAMLASPIGAATAPNGDVYFCELGNNRVCRIAPDGTIEVVLA